MMSTFARSLGISENVISDIRIRIEQNTGRPLKDYSFSTHLNENNKHGLIMHDLNDIIVPVSEAKKNKAYFKNFKFLLTKGLGHNMFSRDVEKTVVDFLKEKGESETNPNYNRLVSLNRFIDHGMFNGLIFIMSHTIHYSFNAIRIEC